MGASQRFSVPCCLNCHTYFCAVQALIEGALVCALDVLGGNSALHEGLSSALLEKEKLEGEELAKWLGHTRVSLNSRLPKLCGRSRGCSASYALLDLLQQSHHRITA